MVSVKKATFLLAVQITFGFLEMQTKLPDNIITFLCQLEYMTVQQALDHLFQTKNSYLATITMLQR